MIKKSIYMVMFLKLILFLSIGMMFLKVATADSLNSILAESAIKQQLPVFKMNASSNSLDKSSNYIITKSRLPVTKNINVEGSQLLRKPLIEKANNQFTNLDAIDKDSNDLNQLNRKLQVEKVEAEIRKIKKAGSDNNANNSNVTISDNAQTTVTGVAINSLGKKIAWLQFTDGGTLTVNIGSSVGKYKVLDIDMRGVTIGEEIGNKKHKHMKTLFLKRVYASNFLNSKHVNSNNKDNLYFTPSPIVTGANAKSDYVPPIVPFN